MSNFDKLIKLISLDFADYPELDLRNQEIVRAQIENVRKFKIIRNRLYLAFVFFFALLSFQEFFVSGYLNLSREEGVHVGLFIGSFFVVGIVILIFMLKFRCPHCGEIPRGRAIDISGGITYSKGIHPFPSRCASCGFYLQVRALKRDMKQQEIQYQQSQELVEERSE